MLVEDDLFGAPPVFDPVLSLCVRIKFSPPQKKKKDTACLALGVCLRACLF